MTVKTAAAKKRPARKPTVDIDAVHAQFAAQVEALRSSDEWQRMLTFAGAFHRYSPTNMLMILMQSPDATRVAGYQKWLELGRQVRKGEKSIRIYAPMRVKVDRADTSPDADTKMLFRLVSVFDLAQTDPIEGVVDKTDVMPEPVLTGDDVTGIYPLVEAYLVGTGWTVTREAIPGGTNGYSTNDGSRRVVIDSGLSPAHAAKVILHEAAHVTLGHCDKPGADYAAHRGAWEIAAESVAHVTATALGLDSSAISVHYVAGWADGADGADAIRSTLAEVMKAVKVLLTAVTPAEAETTDAKEVALAA